MSALALPPLPFPLGVGADELHRLHEHAREAAAGVVHPAAVGLEHLDEQLDHAAGRVELAAFLPLGARELREEVLVDAAEHVLGAGRLVADLDVADQVDELAEARLVERGASVVFGQHTLDAGLSRSMPAIASSTSWPMVGWRATAEEENPADGGYLTPLVVRHEAEHLEITAPYRSKGRKRLGSGSEVQRFRVEIRHRLLVERLPAAEAAKLLDQLAVGSAVGGAHPDVDGAVEPLALEMVRAARARVDPLGQNLGAQGRISISGTRRGAT